MTEGSIRNDRGIFVYFLVPFWSLNPIFWLWNPVFWLWSLDFLDGKLYKEWQSDFCIFFGPFFVFFGILFCIYIYIYFFVCICEKYIERDRDIERERDLEICSENIDMCIYIYIYIYSYKCIYIERE